MLITIRALDKGHLDALQLEIETAALRVAELAPQPAPPEPLLQRGGLKRLFGERSGFSKVAAGATAALTKEEETPPPSDINITVDDSSMSLMFNRPELTVDGTIYNRRIIITGLPEHIVWEDLQRYLNTQDLYAEPTDRDGLEVMGLDTTAAKHGRHVASRAAFRMAGEDYDQTREDLGLPAAPDKPKKVSFTLEKRKRDDFC